ncbi:MAG: YqgE/AlgH family protein [Actinomycetota bacterium]
MKRSVPRRAGAGIMVGVESLRGKLLVAAGSLFDENFRRTVILVADHDEQGAAGVVLNRPAEVTVTDAAPPLAPLVPPEDLLYVGGPVQPTSAVVVADFEHPELADRLVFDSVGLVTGEQAADAPAAIRRARVFAGYAGWGAGQLDAEMDEEAWLVQPASLEDVFTESPDRLWSTVLRRMGGDYAMLALMPHDPSTN